MPNPYALSLIAYNPPAYENACIRLKKVVTYGRDEAAELRGPLLRRRSCFELPFYRLRPDDHTSHSKTPMRWLPSFLDTTRAFDLFVPSRGATGTSCCGKASRSARSESKT